MSRLTLLLSLLGAAGLASAASLGPSCSHGGIANFYKKVRAFSHSDENPFKDDLDHQEDQMNNMAVRLSGVYSALDKARTEGKKWGNYLNDLEAEIEAIEGTHCPEGEVNCQDGYDTCIDKILFCDGVKDCANGHDEDNSSCVNPFEKGSVWNGKMVYDHCTQRQPSKFSITIVDEHPQDHFPSVNVVEAVIFLAGDDIVDHFHVEASFQVHGDYYFGSRRLILQPPEADRLGVMVQYDGHHLKDATAWVVREATMEKCAEISLHRED